MNFLSSFNRHSLLEKLSCESFDLLIIGGGITGAGIALDATTRGLKTALIEKQDFAAGTSSRSTKLIHGGLRYLKNMEFQLVMEVAQERKIIFRNAPHLVKKEKLILPLIKGGTFGKWLTRAGLFVYDVLAQVNSNDWHRMLSYNETIEEEPLLKSNFLLGSGFYSEYRTDDARLTLEVIKTAAKHGAMAANYVAAKQFIYEDNKIAGAICEDVFSKKQIPVKAKMVVNAAGPWVDEIRNKEMKEGKERTDEKKQKHLHLTKGVHLVIAKEKFPLKHAVYFDVADGRMIFAIPRGKIIYIGTTDTDYSGNLENPVIVKEDAEYLLNAANKMFPSVHLLATDIISGWAGLRPLIHEEGKSPSELSRKEEIFISESGLISIAGGKLTGYRKMAEKTVTIICKKINNRKPCKTKGIIINGGNFENPQEINAYIELISSKIKTFGMENDAAEKLVNTYGKQTDEILKKFFEFSGCTENALTRFGVEETLAKAELWFAVNYESAYKLQDFFIRRTGKFLFEPESVKKLLPFILEEMKNYFLWTNDRCEMEMLEMEKQCVKVND